MSCRQILSWRNAYKFQSIGLASGDRRVGVLDESLEEIPKKFTVLWRRRVGPRVVAIRVIAWSAIIYGQSVGFAGGYFAVIS